MKYLWSKYGDFNLSFPQNMAKLVNFCPNKSFIEVTALFPFFGSPSCKILPQKENAGGKWRVMTEEQ
jgi:hypothetical protein